MWTPVCRRCEIQNPKTWSRCPHCGGVQVLNGSPAFDGPSDGRGLWRLRNLVPQMEHEISLGEGSTPLIRCANLAAELGIADVMVKNESVNPTLSFKDRAMALGVSLARDVGSPGVVAASTGNTAVSAAAYAARAQLKCQIYCAASAAREIDAKLACANAYGATIETIKGDYSSAHLAAHAMERHGWMPLTTTFRNPYLAEAYRTITVELFEQLNGDIPDWVLVPVGAGPLLVGIYHGFQVLAAANRVAAPPRLAAVQSDACAPLVDAWLKHSPITAAVTGSTVAGAIADPLRGYEDEGQLTLEAVDASGGLARSVSDQEIVRATRDMTRMEGLMVDPAAAAPVAALSNLIEEGTIHSSARVAVVATGHGAVDHTLGAS